MPHHTSGLFDTLPCPAPSPGRYVLLDVSVFVELLGFLAVFVEAVLGAPQWYRNYTQRSTRGMRCDDTPRRAPVGRRSLFAFPAAASLTMHLALPFSAPPPFPPFPLNPPPVCRDAQCDNGGHVAFGGLLQDGLLHPPWRPPSGAPNRPTRQATAASRAHAGCPPRSSLSAAASK